MNFFGGSKKIEDKGGAVPHQEEYVPPPAPVKREEPRPAYGIQNAILLMRTVPIDQNVELVVAVIKTTLESLKVRVTDIIEDATRRQHEIETRVSDLKSEIVEYEKQILVRKDEISRLEADHAETTTVKQRLELAEKAQRATPNRAAVRLPQVAAGAAGVDD
ncbi:MAG: hypothetical protein ABMB14_33055 [Myxococcota bacterium]